MKLIVSKQDNFSITFVSNDNNTLVLEENIENERIALSIACMIKEKLEENHDECVEITYEP